MRRYDEPVQVRLGETDAGPLSFFWHGRVYDVEAVLDRWVTRLPWWRRALAPDGGVWALEPDQLDERVWRVSAAARGDDPVIGGGVYELSHGRQWHLLRVGD